MATYHEMQVLPGTRVETWSCRWECGYTRAFHTQPEYRVNQVIDHPFYGTVTANQAAMLDIQNHNCETYKESLARIRGRQHFAYILRKALGSGHSVRSVSR